MVAPPEKHSARQKFFSIKPGSLQNSDPFFRKSFVKESTPAKVISLTRGEEGGRDSESTRRCRTFRG
jgi:hypothetical protein